MSIQKTLLVLATAAVVTITAKASPVGDIGSNTFHRVTGYHNSNTGEITLKTTALSLDSYVNNTTSNIGNFDPSFQTFCLELNEPALNTAYFVVNTKTASWSSGGTVYDQISVGTAWLYSQFAKGTLTSYLFNKLSGSGDDRDDTAKALQQAIWMLENEASVTTNVFYNAAVSFFGTAAKATANAVSGQYGVYVLNNFKTAAARDTFVSTGTISKDNRGQDFLYYVASVPEGGASLMLLGAAFGVVAVARRIVRRQA